MDQKKEDSKKKNAPRLLAFERGVFYHEKKKQVVLIEDGFDDDGPIKLVETSKGKDEYSVLEALLSPVSDEMIRIGDFE